MESKYGSAKYCKQGAESCRDETQLKTVLETSRNYDELLDAWQGWHAISRPMRPLYTQLVDLSNAGAKDIGFNDLGTLWRSACTWKVAMWKA